LSDFNGSWNFLQTLEKHSIIKSHENPTSGVELFHVDGQAGWHEEANTQFSQFSESD